MYIAVCDDQLEDLELLEKLLHQWQETRRTPLRYQTFRSAAELLDAAEKEGFTLYLLDVMMPGTDGLTAAREIRRFDQVAEIVFLTASPGFAYESYGVHALDYLLKPIRAELLFPILDKLLRQEQKPEDGLTLKSGATLIRVPLARLVCVEVRHKHLYFDLDDGQQLEVVGSLREYEALLLAHPTFLRVGRAYIVNVLQIRELSPGGITTFSGKSIPIPRRLYPQLQKDYMQLLFNGREV